MFTLEMLQKFQSNPQMLDALAQSPVDPNAIMAMQMGGPSLELPGVHMGTQNPSVPQAPVPPSAPASDPWGALGQMGLGIMKGAQPSAPPPAGSAPIVGGAPKAPVQNITPPLVRPGRSQGLDELLASFRK